MSSNYEIPKFGLELVRHTTKDEVKDSSDAVLVLLHWRLMSRAGLVCVGMGEIFDQESDTEPTELLPDRWSDNPSVRAFKYRQGAGGNKYLLKAVKSGQTLTLILMRVADDRTSQMAVGLAENVEDFRLKKEDVLLQEIDIQLIDPLFPPKEKKMKEPVEKEEPRRRDPDDDPMRDPDFQGPPRRPRMPDFPYPRPPGPDPFWDEVGGADLDPTGSRGSGGMLMGPPTRRGRDRSGPGFDPVYPGIPGVMPGRGRGMGRNLGDAMAPPGFDNMFM